jgi:hypothetical protein
MKTRTLCWLITATSLQLHLSAHAALMGDISGDGTVTAQDASLASRAASGLLQLDAAQTVVGDVNQDGVITSEDAQLIAACAVGVGKLPRRWGDLSGDGEVTAFDASLAISAASGLLQLDLAQTVVGDVNQDGAVTQEDAVLIAAYAVGIGQLPQRILGARLEISRQSQGLVLRWPMEAKDAALDITKNFIDWTEAAAPRVQDGTNLVVTVSMESAPRFFRLRVR